MKKNWMKPAMASMMAAAMCMSSAGAMACTAIYVGADLTEDGSAIFARSEDYANSYAKTFYVSPAGKHKAGDAYKGCYGFTYTFEKDSYSYTAFCDNNGEAVGFECPDCGETHAHTPYEAGGTNEMGVSMSATETLYSTDDTIYELDPFTDIGIEEAEITTVVLSQAATAREGVEILLGIYDTVGCNNGSGIFIGDDKEIWYVENVTGTQYLAVKLSDGVMFAQPNQSVLGLIDLDDTENVIASPKLIELAKQAGTYVGDEAANTIDYVKSYNVNQTPSERMVDAMNFMYGTEDKTAETIAMTDYTISNVDEQGNIVPFYGNIKPEAKYGVDDVIAYYHIPSIGKAGNTEIHIFQIFDEDSVTDTVEWVALDHGGYNAFVPYYPMLTTDTYAPYQLSTLPAEFVTEEPTEGLYYATTSRKRTEEGVVTVEGFKILPENWADSYYWTFDAVSNLMENGKASDEQKAAVNAKLDELQGVCYAVYDELKTAVAGAADTEAAAKAATEISAKTAETVHTAVVELVNGLK